MTTLQTPTPVRKTYDAYDQRVMRYARAATGGLTTAFSATTNVSCGANEIAFIDELTLRSATLDNQFANNATLSGAAVTAIVVASNIPSWVPQTGILTILRDSGIFSEIAYTSWATATFQIGATAFNATGATSPAQAATPVFVSSGNVTVTAEINGVECPIHFEAEPNAAHTEVVRLRPKGNLVLQPSQTIKFKTSSAGVGSTVAFTYRKYTLATAREQGLLGPTMAAVASSRRKTMALGTTLTSVTATSVVVSAAIPSWVPQTGSIAVTRNSGAVSTITYSGWTGSTFTITLTDFSGDNATAANVVFAPVTVAGTTKQIVAAIAGFRIQVLGYYVSGHNYVAADDYLSLGFWEGTGTFFNGVATKAATAHLVTVAHMHGHHGRLAPRIRVDNTDGCVEGPTGYGLYVRASTNVAGYASNADVFVMYRYVKTDVRLHAYSLATALSSGGETAVVAGHAILPDTPQTGTVNITLTDGTILSVPYTSWATTTFAIGSTAFNVTGAAVGALITANREHGIVNDFRGSVTQPIARPGKFWVSTIAAPALFGFGNTTEVLFTQAAAAGDKVVKIKGYVASAIGRDAASTAPIAGISIGATVFAPNEVGIGGSALWPGHGGGATEFASNSLVEIEILIPTQVNLIPSMMAFQANSGDMPVRFQSVWGEFESAHDTTGMMTLIA